MVVATNFEPSLIATRASRLCLHRLLPRLSPGLALATLLTPLQPSDMVSRVCLPQHEHRDRNVTR